MIEIFFPTMPDAFHLLWAWEVLASARSRFIRSRGFKAISISATHNKEDQTTKWSYEVEYERESDSEV